MKLVGFMMTSLRDVFLLFAVVEDQGPKDADFIMFIFLIIEAKKC